MRELAPGIHALGDKKGGRVHSFLIDTDGELTLVDTLFDNDARGVLNAMHSRPQAVGGLKRS